MIAIISDKSIVVKWLLSFQILVAGVVKVQCSLHQGGGLKYYLFEKFRA